MSPEGRRVVLIGLVIGGVVGALVFVERNHAWRQHEERKLRRVLRLYRNDHAGRAN